jgi:hypothetical protein
MQSKETGMPTKIRKLTGFTGDAVLYRLDSGEYVVASAVVAPFSGPETLVFPADESGEVTSWIEIGGVRGLLDHDAALASVPTER